MKSIAQNIAVLKSQDPTRTVSLRRAWVADSDRRFKQLMKDIKISLVDRDVLGLGEQKVFTLAPAEKAAFIFTRDASKHDAFMRWLEKEEKAGILEVVSGPRGAEPWSNTYVRSSYAKGINDAQTKLKASGVDLPANPIIGPEGVAGAFYMPMHAERLALIYTRAYNELKGVTEAMNGRISRTLSRGMAEGVGPLEMARRINADVKGIGLTRARLIARTEVVETFNQAALLEYERAEGIIGEKVKVQWETAGDNRVRPRHQDRDGVVYTRAEAQALLGEPNCRCALLPYIESVHGKGKAPRRGAPQPPAPSTPVPRAPRRRGPERDLKDQLKDSKEWGKGLSTQDRNLVVKGWTEAPYSRLKAMRETLLKGDTTSKHWTKIKAIEKVVKTAPVFEGEVFRGIALPREAGENFMKNVLKAKGMITEPMSPYSRKISIARKFAKPDWQRGKKYDYSIMVEVKKSRSMKMIENASRYDLEGELLATDPHLLKYVFHEERDRMHEGRMVKFIRLYLEEK